MIIYMLVSTIAIIECQHLATNGVALQGLDQGSIVSSQTIPTSP